MAKVPYAVLSPKELKQLLTQVGLSTQGDRSLMEWRHKEFVLRYNAGCDALHPKSNIELVREVEAAERGRSSDRQARVLAANATSTALSADPAAGPHGNAAADGSSRGDAEYISAHKTDFERLVEAARSQGLLTAVAGQNVVRLLPPLIIEERHMDEACDKLRETARLL